jgi:hypothetical protein
MTVANLNQLPLALVAPRPYRLVRRGDSAAAVAAAVDLVESGQDQAQVAFAIALVVSLPGLTSAELAARTVHFGKSQGFDPSSWRYVLGRRLSEAEDEGRGPIVGCENKPHLEKPWRRVDPLQAPCTTNCRKAKAIRWFPATSKGD